MSSHNPWGFYFSPFEEPDLGEPDNPDDWESESEEEGEEADDPDAWEDYADGEGEDDEWSTI